MATSVDAIPAQAQGPNSPDVRNGCARRPPWLILIVGYLCITGLFGTLGTVLQLPSEYNLLWSIRHYFFAEYDWKAPWAWADPSRYLWLQLTYVVSLAAGLLLWRYPTRFRRLAPTVAIVLLIGATLNCLALVGEFLTQGSLYPDWPTRMGLLLPWLDSFAVPIFGLWFVHRVETLRRPAITLAAGYLLLIGAPNLMSHIALLFSGYSFGYPQMLKYSDWPTISWSLLYVIEPLSRFVVVAAFLVCGIVLLKRPARIVAVAWVCLAAMFVQPLVAVLQLVAGYVDMTGLWHGLSFFAAYACPMAMGLFGLTVAYRLRRRWRNELPGCRVCGYNLTGNVSGICPECGTPCDSEADDT